MRLSLIFVGNFREKKFAEEVVTSSGIGLKGTFVERVENFRDCYSASRNQYDAACMLGILENKYDKPFLALFTEDIYIEGMNFVFGVAIPSVGCVVSDFRLRSRKKETYFSRLRKEILHELGHVVGLGHCKHPWVMAFSNSLEEVDLKSDSFCSKCRKKFSERIKVEW